MSRIDRLLASLLLVLPLSLSLVVLAPAGMTRAEEQAPADEVSQDEPSPPAASDDTPGEDETSPNTAEQSAPSDEAPPAAAANDGSQPADAAPAGATPAAAAAPAAPATNAEAAPSKPEGTSGKPAGKPDTKAAGPATAAQGPVDYYTKRAKETLKDDDGGDDLTPHPLAEQHPDQNVVVCEGGCQHEKGAEIVGMVKKGVGGETSMSEMVPTAADAGGDPSAASVYCIAGCYSTPDHYAAIEGTSTDGTWLTTVTPEPSTMGPQSGSWMHRINKERAGQPSQGTH